MPLRNFWTPEQNLDDTQTHSDREPGLAVAAPSPCIKQCKLENGRCVGCLRNVAEITNWSRYSTQEKLLVLAAVAKRK